MVERCAPGIDRISIPIPVPLKAVNAYLCAGDDGYSIVDCGFHDDATEIHWQSVLEEIQIKPQDIKQIIVTHLHPDHYGAAGWLQQWTKAPVLMLNREAARVRRIWHPDYADELERLMKQHGMPADRAVAVAEEHRLRLRAVEPQPRIQSVGEGVPLQLAGHSFRPIWTPGHSDGLMVLWCPENRLLFANDMVLSDITPNISVAPWGSPNPLKLYLQSLKEVSRLPARRTLTGHRDPVEHLAERCQEIASHHQKRLQETYEIVVREAGQLNVGAYSRSNGITAWQVCLQLFGTYEQAVQTRFAMAETLAHLEYLVGAGSLGKEEQGGMTFYRIE